MEDQNKQEEIKAKHALGDCILVKSTEAYPDGDVGVIIDFQRKTGKFGFWLKLKDMFKKEKYENTETTYFYCPLKDLGYLERKTGGNIDPASIMNLSKWVKESDVVRLDFTKSSFFDIIKYPGIVLAAFLLGVSSCYLYLSS